MKSLDTIPNARAQFQRPADVDSLEMAEEGWAPAQEEHTDGTEWAPGKKEYAVMITIATVSLMVALDATILVPVLPVGIPFTTSPRQYSLHIARLYYNR